MLRCMGPYSRPLRSLFSFALLALAASAFGCATYYPSGYYDRGYYGSGYGRPSTYHRHESYGYSVYERPYPVYVPVYRDRYRDDDGDRDDDHHRHSDRDRNWDGDGHHDRDWDGDRDHADRGRSGYGGYAPQVVAPPARPRPPDDRQPEPPRRVDRHRGNEPRELADERGSSRANDTVQPGDRGGPRQDAGAPQRGQFRPKLDRDESAED